MRPPDPRLRQLAQRLITLEAASAGSGEATGLAPFIASERLRRPLATLAGVAGFRALLGRALALAGDEVPWLKAVRVNPDATLNGSDVGHLAHTEITEGEAVLLAQLIGLLVTFIGETMTLRLLEEAWPGTSLADLSSKPERE